MAEGGLEECKVAPGDRRRGGPLHDEMVQGRSGEELSAPRSRKRQEQQQRETGGVGRGGRGSRTDTVVDECSNKWQIV